MEKQNKKDQLRFKSTYDLRRKIIEVYKEEGMEGLQNYLKKEFKHHRTLQIGEKSSTIFDFQLLNFRNNKPADIIIDYQNNPTLQNSMLLLTMNLIEIEPKMQLVIRKEQS